MNLNTKNVIIQQRNNASFSAPSFRNYIMTAMRNILCGSNTSASQRRIRKSHSLYTKTSTKSKSSLV